MAAQLALTLVLLAGAGLFVQTLARLYTRERGFDSSRLVMFRVDPAGTGSPGSDAPRVMLALLQTLQGAPIAASVLIGDVLPACGWARSKAPGDGWRATSSESWRLQRTQFAAASQA